MLVVALGQRGTVHMSRPKGNLSSIRYYILVTKRWLTRKLPQRSWWSSPMQPSIPPGPAGCLAQRWEMPSCWLYTWPGSISNTPMLQCGGSWYGI